MSPHRSANHVYLEIRMDGTNIFFTDFSNGRHQLLKQKAVKLPQTTVHVHFSEDSVETQILEIN